MHLQIDFKLPEISSIANVVFPTHFLTFNAAIATKFRTCMHLQIDLNMCIIPKINNHSGIVNHAL